MTPAVLVRLPAAPATGSGGHRAVGVVPRGACYEASPAPPPHAADTPRAGRDDAPARPKGANA